MSARQKYSDDFKAEALAVYVEDGPAATARLYGMPVRTLQSWAQRMGLRTAADTKTETEAACAKNQELRAKLRTKLLEKCVDMLERMDSPHYEYQGREQERVVYPVAGAKECQSYATALGIMLDKFRLEVGEPTGREEVRHDYSDRSDADLIREAEGILRDAAEQG